MDISKDFIDYWDDVINIWLGKKDKLPNKNCPVEIDAQRLNKDGESYYKDEGGKLYVEIEKEQAEWLNATDKLLCPIHMPEPYWGDPCNCSIVIVNYNPAGGTGMNQHTYRGIGDSYPANTMIKYVNENKYSQLAMDFPILKSVTDLSKDERWWLCSYEGRTWWRNKMQWMQHLEESILQERNDSQDAKASLPFCIELCAWHSPNWPNNMKGIYDKLKDSITNRFVDPLLYAIEKSDCHLAVCIGAQYSSENFQKFISKYPFRDLTNDIYKQLKQSEVYNVQPPKAKENAQNNEEDKSIKVTIEAKGKKTSRFYRVYNIYNEFEEKNHIILNTFAPGGNHHPAQTFWEFEKNLLTVIKSYL